MTEQELKELIESATNAAWDKNDLLPNIQARLFYKLKQALRIRDVVGRSEQLLEEQSNWLMANTSLEVEKIVDFKEHFK